MGKQYLTTFEAAEALAVSPDTVLRWIKSGRIKAQRTLGGHFRIQKNTIDELVAQAQRELGDEQVCTAGPYCWEYYSKAGVRSKKCDTCIVFKAQVKNCYELSAIPEKYGHLKLFCASSCEECAYFRKQAEAKNKP